MFFDDTSPPPPSGTVYIIIYHTENDVGPRFISRTPLFSHPLAKCQIHESDTWLAMMLFSKPLIFCNVEPVDIPS